MALTDLQRSIVRSIARNRSETSYIAGGLALNMTWPRLSDDIDIFHDTDEEIGAAAEQDLQTLRDDGFRVSVDINIYGCVEASVIRGGERTLIQWMSESRTRFFPIVRDDEWGARLHPLDLAINKILAASTRRQARDYVDSLEIDGELAPLGALLMAAAGKPPHFSPLRMIEDMRRKALSMTDGEYLSVKGLPDGWTPSSIREGLAEALANAERYVMSAPPDLVGLLAVDQTGHAVEVAQMDQVGVSFRQATSEPEVMPDLPDLRESWRS